MSHRIILVLGLALLAGCGESITGEPVVNSAPDTEVTATPPVLSTTDYRVSFFWTGSDPDGKVRRFQWRISDNGADGIVDVEDTLSTRLPWHETTSTDSTFVVSADLPGFGKDVADSVSPKSTRFWQTHTFFVRAVDDEGMVDPSPAHVSFTATTLAPTVQVTLPPTVQPQSCSQAPPAIAFGWQASDPDNQEKVPQSVRYLLKKYGNADENCLLKVDFEAGAFPIRNDDPAWSEWIRYDAPLDSGVLVRFPARPAADVGTSYVFAVQARDVAGAVTPVFEWGRNVRHVRISDTQSPFLTVTERFLGTQNFVKTSILRRFTIASEQRIEFKWVADASRYGNLIEGYRYGFNLLDPDDADDPGWVVPWGNGPNWRRAAPRTFPQGSPNFVVQARDNSNQLSRGTYLFQVVQVARRSEQRRLLLVDDHPKSVGVVSSEQLDQRWDERWRSIIQSVGVTGFQSADVVDATDNPLRLTFPLVNDYRGVVWFIGPGESFFQTQLAPINRESPQFNWLEVYQSFVGNVLFVGSSAMEATLEPHNQEYPLVFNGSGRGTLGTIKGPEDEVINVGTLRYPYTGWCLETLDKVRPPLLKISGETAGAVKRETRCSAIVYAGPASEFYAAYDATPADVGALFPDDIRRYGSYRYFIGPGGQDPTELNTLALNLEEFYNANVTSRPVQINLRDCQVPMYRAVARRDVDAPSVFSSSLATGWDAVGLRPSDALVDSVYRPDIDPVGNGWVDDCASQLSRDRRATSPISLQAIGIASRVFSGYGDRPATKQNGMLLSSDFLWGFNPLGFEQTGVRNALKWIIVDHWGVNTDF